MDSPDRLSWRQLRDAAVRRARPSWIRRPIEALRSSYQTFGPLEQLHLPQAGRLWAVAPHPDDESIGCGGLMLLWPGDTEVAFLTRGERGSPEVRDTRMSDSVRRTAVEAIMATRKQEASRAMDRLGARAHWLDGPDGALARDVSRIGEILAGLWRDLPPDWIAAPFPADGHGDHAAAARIVGLAARALPSETRVLCYEVWSANPANAVLDINAVAERKWATIREYRSQLRTTDYLAGTMGLNRFRAVSSGLGAGHAEAFFSTTIADYGRMADQLRV